MLRKLCVLGVVWLCASTASAQITVTSPPAGTTSVGPANDYATRAFQDPWDMNQYTDVGWFMLGNDQPAPGLSAITVSGGHLTANITAADHHFDLLDTRVPGNARLGKIGANHPIDSNTYRMLLFSMCINGSVPGTSQWQLLWSNNTIFTSESGGGYRASGSPFPLSYSGCNIYVQDLQTMTHTAVVGGAVVPWNQLPVDSLRIDPSQFLPGAPATLDVDWVRLVNLDDVNLRRNITWTGGSGDIYLDTDSNSLNGGLVQIGRSQASPFSFYIGGVQPGDYFVRVCAAGGTTTCDYSSGIFRVLSQPTFTFTNPGTEGSSDDFATTQLNNAWDMNATSDIAQTFGLNSLTATTINAVNEAGTSLGSVPVLLGTSTAVGGPAGDPVLYPLFHTTNGLNNRIDTDRYRILTLEMGIPGARDLTAGSVARVIWKISDEVSDENVSQDIGVNHRNGVNVLAKISADMKDTCFPGQTCHLAIEDLPGGSPDTRGWINGADSKPGVASFRIDPHEFPPATQFYIRRVKLAALEKAGASSYQINWSYSNPSALGTTLTLIASNPISPGSGATPSCTGLTIASGLNPASGSFTWSGGTLPSFANGTERHICAQVFQGATLVNQVISKYPIERDTAFTGTLPPRLVPERTLLRFGGTNTGPVLTVTPPQTVGLGQVGAGTVNWTATSNQPWLSVSPGSGTGSDQITVTVVGPGTSLPATGLLYATVTITSNATNSPQYIDVYVNLMAVGSTQVPFGSFDAPTDGATGLQGAFGITGWALDDVGVQKVELWRSRVNGDPAPAPNGLIFIGNATIVSGARPDVEAIYSTLPQAYHAAWGYALLTNLLPNVNTGAPAGGVGTFTLYAYIYDVEGKITLLPTKTFTCNNATGATKPFGTIDTPQQGETVSGTINNFGWALTPQPSTIPTNGSTITLFIDGIPRGTATGQYNFPRSDLAGYFPGLNNTNGPVGRFIIDTTTLSNGVHTIAWLVTDNNGNAEGLGSRYFIVLN